MYASAVGQAMRGVATHRMSSSALWVSGLRSNRNQKLWQLCSPGASRSLAISGVRELATAGSGGKKTGPKPGAKMETDETANEDSFIDDTDILASMKRQALREEAEKRRLDNEANGGDAASAGTTEAERELARLKKLKEQQEAEENKAVAKSMKNFGYYFGGAVLLTCIYLGYPTAEDMKREGETVIGGYPGRIWNNMMNARKSVNEPDTTKLLPDTLPPPYAHPLTLCIELQDSLLHMDWDRTRGWAIQTRPGVRQFLSSIGRYYEVVVFTTQPAWLADQVCQSFDPMFFYTMYRLYRDHTTKIGGAYVKNLDHLNRNVGKTVIVDIDPDSYQLQPENGLKLKKWTGEKDDRELKKLEIFLEEFAKMVIDFGIKDVRPIIQQINKFDAEDPVNGWQEYKKLKREQFEEELRIEYPEPKANLLLTMLSYVGIRLQPQRPMNAIDFIESQAKLAHEQFLREMPKQQANLKKLQEDQQALVKKHIEDNKKKGLKLWDYMNGAGAPEGMPGAPQQEGSQPAPAAPTA